MLDAITIECPWCGERFATVLDASGGNAEYVEDCQVCCRPIVFQMEAEGDSVTVRVRRED